MGRRTRRPSARRSRRTSPTGARRSSGWGSRRSNFIPHPEEPCEAWRLEGSPGTTTVQVAILRDALPLVALLRMRFGVVLALRIESLPEPPAIMPRLEIQRRSERYDAAWIDVQHAHVIVPLDVIDVHPLGHARHLVEIAQIVRQVRIVRDAAQVAFEVAVVDGIEAHERRKQPPVCFGDLRSTEIALA